ncbi:MAG: Sec-independent protein translocase subunit TatA [Gallionellaceae bacterium]|nr:Sec-independent protein translocase subunit TatA [Gallionellaceae bacterium]MDD5364950.1 Sec-independent protein translocase subunit TatA [Gallionellaceae bacterium]
MGSFSIWHWMIVLVVVLLIFGTKKLKNIGGDLGGAVKGFKEAMKEEQNKPAELPRQGEQADKEGTTIDVEVKDKQQS